jgi:pyruvate kinase
MASIARRTEEALDHAAILARRGRFGQMDSVTEAISHATVTTANDLQAAAIISATQSGFTARMVSKYRPACPIVAVTPDEAVARKLRLVFGVVPVVKPEAHETDSLIERAVEGALESGLVKNGDLVVITAGVPVGVQGSTNLIKVHTVADVLVSGIGIGRKSVTGRARIVQSEADVAAFQDGEILITHMTDAEYIPAMERCGGIVTEEGGLTSHAAVAGLSLGKPVIVGAAGALAKITNGMVITLDVAHGQVLRGEANVR